MTIPTKIHAPARRVNGESATARADFEAGVRRITPDTVKSDLLDSTQGGQVQDSQGKAVVAADPSKLKVSDIEHPEMESVMLHARVGVPIMLVGPTGSGKTYLSQQVAKKLNKPFYMTGSLDSDIKLKGFTDAHGRQIKTAFYDAYKNGGVFLLDEMDNCSPSVLVALNNAIDGWVTEFESEMVERHQDFVLIATANTWGYGATNDYVGRTQIDASTLQRFAQIHIDYDEEMERKVVEKNYGSEMLGWVDVVQILRKGVKDLRIKHIISPRSSYNGAKVIKEGLSYDQALEQHVFRGMEEQQRLQLIRHCMDDIEKAFRKRHPGAALKRTVDNIKREIGKKDSPEPAPA